MKIFENLRERREKSRRKRIEEYAKEVFQVTEYNGKLWFMCNNVLFCPCHFVSEKDTEIVSMLIKLRELYVERQCGTNKNDIQDCNL